MDPQLTQQLTQLVQQMLQVLQSGGAAANPDNAQPSMDAGDPDMMDDEEMPDDMSGMDDDDTDPGMTDDSGFGDGDDDNDDMTGDDDMAGDATGQPSLHDRISQLESHTGLKKSASVLTFAQRVDALENELLGEEYEGPMVDRVAQLEKAAGVNLSKSVAQDESEDEAPDVIPLDALIKSAIQEGVKLASQQNSALIKSAVDEAVKSALTEPVSDEIPSPASMRKAAKQAQYGQRKSQAPLVTDDDALIKSAQEWGYSEEDLDKPVGLADALQIQFMARQNGTSVARMLGDED